MRSSFAPPDFWSILFETRCPPLLRFSLLYGSFPLSFVSRAGETPLFGFLALWHHYEAADSIRRFPGLRFVHSFGFTPSLRTYLHHQPPRSQAYFIPEAPMGFPLQGFPLKQRSACSHKLHSLMLLRRRWPPCLLPCALVATRFAVRSASGSLSVVRVRSRGLRCLAAGPVDPLLSFSFLGFCPQRSIGNPFRPPPLVPLGERAPIKFLAIHRLQSLFATP